MIKVIFFDLDGTLLDSELYWRQTGLRLLCSKNLLMPQDILERQDEMAFSTTLRELLSRPDYAAEIGMTLEECIAWGRQNLSELYRTRIPLKPHARELLQYVKSRGFKTVLVTASTEPDVQAVFERFDIGQYFDLVHSTYNQPENKSKPALFERLAAQMGAVPAECIHVDDARYALQGARDAGMQAWAVADAVHTLKIERVKAAAHRYFETLAEVEEALHEVE